MNSFTAAALGCVLRDSSVRQEMLRVIGTYGVKNLINETVKVLAQNTTDKSPYMTLTMTVDLINELNSLNLTH